MSQQSSSHLDMLRHWRSGEQWRHVEARDSIAGETQVEEWSTRGNVEPGACCISDTGEHLETMETWVHHTWLQPGELTNDTCSCRSGGGHQGQVVRRRSNIHVQWQTGVGDGRVALDERVDSWEGSSLSSLSSLHAGSCE